MEPGRKQLIADDGFDAQAANSVYDDFDISRLGEIKNKSVERLKGLGKLTTFSV
jgi:hypothetical protein